MQKLICIFLNSDMFLVDYKNNFFSSYFLS